MNMCVRCSSTYFYDHIHSRIMSHKTKMKKIITTDIVSGSNLLVILTHEFGHALGINHSTVRKAIMYADVPFQNVRHCSLHKDDKAAIRVECTEQNILRT